MFDCFTKRFNYPKGFWPVFNSEVLLNFAFYGLKSLFVLYAVHVRMIHERDAITLFATLMSMSYGASLLGGFIADKLMNPGTTLVMGGILAAAGVLVLLLFSDQGSLCLALAMISLGSGCFKPNISSSLSLLFDGPDDPRREETFTGLYVGMNLGALCGPLLTGLVCHHFGWNWGIGSIFAGFFLASLVYAICMHPEKARIRTSHGGKRPWGVALVVCMVLPLWFLYRNPFLFRGMMGASVFFGLGVGVYIYLRCDGNEKKDLLRLAPFMLLFTFFCALYEQAGSSIVLFMERYVDRRVMGYEIPASSILALNAVFVLVFGPILSFLERKIGLNGKADNLFRFSMGFVLVGFSFFLLVAGIYLSGEKVSLVWVVLFFLIQTLGELWIIPVGFSCVSRYAPPRYISIFMSLWMMCIASGNYIAGLVARFSVVSGDGLAEISSGQNARFFMVLSIISLLGTVPVLYRIIRFGNFFGIQETKG